MNCINLHTSTSCALFEAKAGYTGDKTCHTAWHHLGSFLRDAPVKLKACDTFLEP